MDKLGRVALAADGSDILLELMVARQVQVDYLKVGPWIGVDRMRHRAANYPVLLHLHTSLIGRSIQSEISVLQNLIQQTQPPFVSFHLDVPANRIFRFWKKAGVPIPIFRRDFAARQAIGNIRLLQQTFDIPIAIENQAYHRRNGHDYLVDPDFVREIAQATGCKLLLDLGHARVSAAMWGETANDYILRLPLDEVLEIHISGPRLYKGRLRDLHQPLTDEDYDLLRFALPYCPNLRVITLEYYGPADLLIRQLQALRQILNVTQLSP